MKLIVTVIIIVLVLFIELQRHPGPEPAKQVIAPTTDEQQSGSQPDDRYVQFAQWAATTINTTIYWTLTDLLLFSEGALERWKNIQNPFFRFLIFFGAVMGLLNVALALKRSLMAKKMAIFCPYPDCRASGQPIPGSWNRYRCKRGHQFNGESHGIY